MMAVSLTAMFSARSLCLVLLLSSGIALTCVDGIRQEADLALAGYPPRFGFSTRSFPREDVANQMVYVTCDGRNAIGEEAPKEFGGLWWMDGNPAPETVASFGHAEWTRGVEACKKVKLSHYSQKEADEGTIKDPFGNSVPCQGRMILAFWEDRMWAMPSTSVGFLYEEAGTVGDSHMEFVCGGPDPENLTVCKVGASTGPEMAEQSWFKLLPKNLRDLGAQAFNALAKFSMVKVNEDYWIRYSLGSRFPYHLKRISDCRGQPVARHWDQFTSNGTAAPYHQRDVYGNGGDNRSHVADVPSELFVRVSNRGSCRKDTGGTCSTGHCAPESRAECSESACLCGNGTCAQDGKCGGNETWANQEWWLDSSASAPAGSSGWWAAALCLLVARLLGMASP